MSKFTRRVAMGMMAAVAAVSVTGTAWAETTLERVKKQGYIRVGFARALAMRPRVMLFDEVTSALDPELVGEVLNAIRKLSDKHDLTMLMVTHQMGFAKEFADRVCFFYEGKIAEQGDPEQLFGNPQNDRTRQFLNAVLEAG